LSKKRILLLVFPVSLDYSTWLALIILTGARAFLCLVTFALESSGPSLGLCGFLCQLLCRNSGLKACLFASFVVVCFLEILRFWIEKSVTSVLNIGLLANLLCLVLHKERLLLPIHILQPWKIHLWIIHRVCLNSVFKLCFLNFWWSPDL